MMKFATTLTFVCLALLFHPVKADELSEADRETIAFCEEQSRLAGIEEAQEKNDYIQVCAGNYGVVIGDAKAADQ